MLSVSTRTPVAAGLPAGACLPITARLPAPAFFRVTTGLRRFERESVAIYLIYAPGFPGSPLRKLSRNLFQPAAAVALFSEPPCRYRLWRVPSTIGPKSQ